MYSSLQIITAADVTLVVAQVAYCMSLLQLHNYAVYIHPCWVYQRIYFTPGPVSTLMGDLLRSGKPSRYVTATEVDSVF